MISSSANAPAAPTFQRFDTSADSRVVPSPSAPHQPEISEIGLEEDHHGLEEEQLTVARRTWEEDEGANIAEYLPQTSDTGINRKWPVVDNDAPTADDAVPTVPSPPDALDSALDDMATPALDDAPTVVDAVPALPSLSLDHLARLANISARLAEWPLPSSSTLPDSALDDMAAVVDNDTPTVWTVYTVDDALTVDDVMPTVHSPPAPDFALDVMAPTVDDVMPTMAEWPLPSPPAPDSALDAMAPAVDNDAPTVWTVYTVDDAPTVDHAMPTVPSPPAPDSALDAMAPTVDDAPVLGDDVPVVDVDTKQTTMDTFKGFDPDESVNSNTVSPALSHETAIPARPAYASRTPAAALPTSAQQLVVEFLRRELEEAQKMADMYRTQRDEAVSLNSQFSLQAHTEISTKG
eukprot:9481256-Pyramimonas_sp.AAC.1